jgi:hypothetical protein
LILAREEQNPHVETLTPAGSEMVARKLQQQREGGSREEAAEGYDEAGLILLGHT